MDAINRRSSIARNPNNEYYFPPGTKLSDFEIGEELGEGSFASVYFVRYKRTGQAFALKQFDKHKLRRLKKSATIAAEAVILDKLNHPNIIQLYMVFEDQKTISFLLELGLANLTTIYSSLFDDFVDDHIVQFCAAEVFDAIDYLHSNEILHRDIKPENVIIGFDGHMKLTDFGTAKDYREIRRMEEAMMKQMKNDGADTTTQEKPTPPQSRDSISLMHSALFNYGAGRPQPTQPSALMPQSTTFAPAFQQSPDSIPTFPEGSSIRNPFSVPSSANPFLAKRFQTSFSAFASSSSSTSSSSSSSSSLASASSTLSQPFLPSNPQKFTSTSFLHRPSFQYNPSRTPSFAAAASDGPRSSFSSFVEYSAGMPTETAARQPSLIPGSTTSSSFFPFSSSSSSSSSSQHCPSISLPLSSHTFVGSPHYISPELLLSTHSTSASDAWCCGGLLYFLCFGRPPFRGRTVFEVEQSILRGDIGLPRAVKRLERMWKKEEKRKEKEKEKEKLGVKGKDSEINTQNSAKTAECTKLNTNASSNTSSTSQTNGFASNHSKQPNLTNDTNDANNPNQPNNSNNSNQSSHPHSSSNHKQRRCHRPVHVTPHSLSLLRSLLVLDPSQRLTLAEAKRHLFFEGVDWQTIRSSPSPLLRHMEMLKKAVREQREREMMEMQKKQMWKKKRMMMMMMMMEEMTRKQNRQNQLKRQHEN